MNRGFTLIELIIYIGIVVVFLLGAINFGLEIIYGNIKAGAIREVQQNARFAMEKMARIIEEAKAINSPEPGNSANSFSLEMTNPSLNPTIFDVSNNKLRLTQGMKGSYELTSDRVIVSGLQFTNLSYVETPGTVLIEMKIDHINPGNQREYAVSFEIKSTASLVYGGTAPFYVSQRLYRWRNDDGGE